MTITTDATLSNFEIIQQRLMNEDPVIRCRDGKQIVLVRITHEAWEDALAIGHDEGSLTVEEETLLARTHLREALIPLIQDMYRDRKVTRLDRFGGTYPLIVIKYADMAKISDQLSREVLDRGRKARFDQH